jgi:O-antigen ligase
MGQTATKIFSRFGDRINWMAVLIVACFVSVLLLSSQSAASYPTYALALLMIFSFEYWKDVFQLKIVRWVGLLLLWLSLSTLWSDTFDLREATSVWTRALLVFFFVVAFAECQLRGQIQRWMAWGLSAAGSLAVGAAMINYFLTNPDDGRLNGLGQLDTHVIAALVYGVVLIFVIRALQLTDNKVITLITASAILLVSIAIFLSDSRNAWVSITIGVATYLTATKVEDPRRFLATLAALGVLMLFLSAAIFLNDTTRELLLPRGSSFRLEIWSATWQNIVSGSGLYIGRGILTSDDIIIGEMMFSHPHNLYLALLHQGGVIGLVLYLRILVSAAHSFFLNLEHSDAKLGLAILVIAVLAHTLDGHELVDKIGDSWFLVWMPIGLAIGLSWKPANETL